MNPHDPETLARLDKKQPGFLLCLQDTNTVSRLACPRCQSSLTARIGSGNSPLQHLLNAFTPYFKIIPDTPHQHHCLHCHRNFTPTRTTPHHASAKHPQPSATQTTAPRSARQSLPFTKFSAPWPRIPLPPRNLRRHRPW